jgi:hypothetical protein
LIPRLCTAGSHVWPSPARVLAAAARLPRRSRSYRRLREMTLRGDGWAVLVGAA